MIRPAKLRPREADGRDSRELGIVAQQKDNGGRRPIWPAPIERVWREAGFAGPPMLLIVAMCTAASLFVALASFIVPAGLVPFIALWGAYIPWEWVYQRAQARAHLFLQEYPSVLLAMASSLRAGLDPYGALERAVQLLPPESEVRKEVTKLSRSIEKGVDKERAVASFAEDIRLPDLQLFRRALAVALSQGGRCSPTLERLAEISRERLLLSREVVVTTGHMRLTAHVLLAVTPLVVLLLGAHIQGFWSTLVYDETARTVVGVGAVLILGNYQLVRVLSRFEP